MRSNSLNADVNAFDRLQIVRGRNCSYLCSSTGHARACEMFGGFQFAFHKVLVDNDLRRDIGEFTPVPSIDLLSHQFEVALHPVDANGNAVD
jgi:hypothetical protein